MTTKCDRNIDPRSNDVRQYKIYRRSAVQCEARWVLEYVAQSKLDAFETYANCVKHYSRHEWKLTDGGNPPVTILIHKPYS